MIDVLPAPPLLTSHEAQQLPMVLVLASGKGERFIASGGTTHKLHADLLGRTVLQRTLDAVRGSGLRWHLEDAGHPGMGDSIAAAVRATGNALGWMVLPADLPLVLPQTLVQVAQAPMEGDVLVPWVGDMRGHPVRFAAAWGPQLMALSGPNGASSVVAQSKVSRIAVDDPGCVIDIDTVSDLHRARELLLQRSDRMQ